MEFGKYFEVNYNKIMMSKFMRSKYWYTIGKFIALNVYIRKKKVWKISDLNINFEKQKHQKQIKPQKSREEIDKVRDKDLKHKDAMEKSI